MRHYTKSYRQGLSMSKHQGIERWCRLFLHDSVRGSIARWRLFPMLRQTNGEDSRMIDLQKLFTDVFDPQPGETALVLLDTPHGHIADTPAWAQRRAMAERWYQALAQLSSKRHFRILPLVSYPATGAHNAQLPGEGYHDGASMVLEDLAAQATLI